MLLVDALLAQIAKDDLTASQLFEASIESARKCAKMSVVGFAYEQAMKYCILLALHAPAHNSQKIIQVP